MDGEYLNGLLVAMDWKPIVYRSFCYVESE
jgi:hypothetical protein